MSDTCRSCWVWGVLLVDRQAELCRELRASGACVVQRRKVVVVERWRFLGTPGPPIGPAAVTKSSDVDRA